MTLLRGLWRVVRAVGCGLGYAALLSAAFSSPFVVLLSLQPPCNQATSICEDGGFGLFTIFVAWLGALVGFGIGIVFSARRVRPISRVIHDVVRRLRRAQPLGRTLGIVILTGLLGSIGWLIYWINRGPAFPPQVSLNIEVPFAPSLGVGLARIETFHQGDGCVRFGTRDPDGRISGATIVYAISSTQRDEICPGVNQPEFQGLLVVSYDDPNDRLPPPHETAVEVYMAPNWYDKPSFGTVSFPSLTPHIIELDSLSGKVRDDPLIWRIRLDGIGDGFAVPFVIEARGELEPSLYKIDEYGNRTDLTTRAGAPAWAHACDRHTCDLGWAVVVWPSDSKEVATISIQMELWIFDTRSNPTLTVASCTEDDQANYAIECSSDNG